MEGLIKVQHDNDRITILAGDLHGFLEIESDFTTWLRRMCEHGFEEVKDFVSFLEESTGGQPAANYQITIEMTKEIAMIQCNEKGGQTKQYFIRLGNDWDNPQRAMARALQMSQKEL